MPPEKRNNFLDADESEDDGSQGYDSEIEQLHKGGRIAKRRKLSDDAASDEDDEHSAEEEIGDNDIVEEDGDDDDDEVEDDFPTKSNSAKLKPEDLQTELPDISRPLTKKNLVATEKAIKKSGLVYLSRIPPFMKPMKLRSLLEPYGKINRIFLTPEDPQERSRRIRQGGNKKHMYTDGWVEFVEKKDAKKAVDLLNARTIGGKKNSYYRDDIWNLLYLKGFKWHNLTEQINSEMAERTSRMRAEISKSTKENKEFVRNIEKAKVLGGIQAKAAAKRSRGEDDTTKSVPITTKDSEDYRNMRKFKQASVGRNGVEKAPEEAKRVLSQLF
ncbi:Pre-rRNA-processing protein ESF2 [Annulohypoxylon maeteangense]|uniref:Pre-rRNA-processing protein ESF2 n=1 Tax=Annulohypoxylon maeteangense TaxID=1927788 RepID=UPI002007F627|nr:Pre-rRNA-processing protein ESF2 [Annulohypoxylon maeteangense]KAI0889536.1 Pre-rRNA-processing protein ESF2 [Annulohypoxylon maeteangense]